MCGQVCRWHADVHPVMCVQAMGKSVLFIHAAVPPPPLPRNGGISSLHPWSSPPAPPPLPGRKRSLGESYSPYKDEKQNFVPGEQLRRSYISLTAHPPLPDDPITLPLFFQIGPHLFLSFAKPCCLCLSCSLRLLPMKLSSWRAPRAWPWVPGSIYLCWNLRHLSGAKNEGRKERGERRLYHLITFKWTKWTFSGAWYSQKS